MLRPLFSCVMPVKGERPFMKEALASLEAQGMGDDLEIIVQDGSGELFDCSDSSIVRLKNEGVNIRWEREPDQGQSDALNKGFAKAKGEWFFWLNADDVLLPGALNRTIRTIEHSNNSLSWIAGNVVEIDAEGRVIRCLWDRGRKSAYAGLPVRVYGPSSFIRRDLWAKMGGLDEQLRVCMDTDLWCKLRANGYWFKKVPDYIWGFRIHDGSTTRSATRSVDELARQRREVEMVHARYGVSDSRLRNMWLRFNRLTDGGYLKSWRDTRRLQVSGFKFQVSGCRFQGDGWKFCWWTIFPTTYMKALLDGMRNIGLDVTVCYFGEYDRSRLEVGWKPRQLEPWEHQVRGISDARRQIPDFDERIQMVPSFFNLTSWKLILRCTLKGLPWFSITEGTRGRWMTRPLFRTFCWFVNRFALKLFVTGGPRTRQQFVDAGVRSEKIVPFSYATMAPPEAAIGLGRRSRSTAECSDSCVFVYAGAFDARKATDVLLAAWGRLHREYPAAKLILAGGGEWQTRVEAIAVDLSGGVEYVGAIWPEKIYEVICRGDVMLLPSRYDPWGVALVEGGMAGLAMVGSDRTGAAEELVEDGVNGFVVKAGDEDDLLRVLRIYAADPAFARRHGEKARIAAERTTGESLAHKLVVGLAKEQVAASFWEEHCTECGEPECYRTCAKYVKGRGGRCRRFEGGLQESILCANTEVKFLPWGKMEAYFHGGMITRSRAVELERLMKRTAWIRWMFPKWWRSWRWRWALRGAVVGCPKVWRCVATAERDERLVFAVVTSRGEDIVSTVVELKAGARKEVELRLPQSEDGTLFRIFTQNGEGTARIRFECNELTDSARVDTSSTVVKCLAWDLDGTLWEGTLSEDGEEGLTLNAKAVDIIKELDRRGIVNSISSRNDPAEALAALKKFGIEEYFVFPQINWGPKSEGLRNLAKEMNIGLDAIAFIDDREEMRGEVRTNASEVRVFAAEEMEGLLARPEFNPSVSAESGNRRASYRAEMVRRDAAKAFGGDRAAFLADSGLQFEFLPVEGDAVTRCRELVQRTNQLNLTARRYDEKAFAALLSESECKAVRVWDRYGDYGIVGFVAMKGPHIVELCFSCRVAEKGIEKRVLEKIAAGRKLTADIVETARNGKIREIVREFLWGKVEVGG